MEYVDSPVLAVLGAPSDRLDLLLSIPADTGHFRDVVATDVGTIVGIYRAGGGFRL